MAAGLRFSVQMRVGVRQFVATRTVDETRRESRDDREHGIVQSPRPRLEEHLILATFRLITSNYGNKLVTLFYLM